MSQTSEIHLESFLLHHCCGFHVFRDLKIIYESFILPLNHFLLSVTLSHICYQHSNVVWPMECIASATPLLRYQLCRWEIKIAQRKPSPYLEKTTYFSDFKQFQFMMDNPEYEIIYIV